MTSPDQPSLGMGSRKKKGFWFGEKSENVNGHISIPVKECPHLQKGTHPRTKFTASFCCSHIFFWAEIVRIGLGTEKLPPCSSASWKSTTRPRFVWVREGGFSREVFRWKIMIQSWSFTNSFQDQANFLLPFRSCFWNKDFGGMFVSTLSSQTGLFSLPKQRGP